MYRPPYSSLHPVSTSAFFDEFSQFLENVVMCPEALVISGDFNLHLDDLRDYDTKKFMNLLETFSLSQHVSGPTHLSADIASSILCASVQWDNIDALSDCFYKTLTDMLDRFSPLKTRTMINRPKVPWFNDDIKQLKRQRRRLEKRAVKTDLPGDWNNYRKVRNQYSAFLKSARWIIQQQKCCFRNARQVSDEEPK
ncbi:hypothetical protein pdam_00019047 [Pocillopora damicornis]|uniref:Endonuclease/exonuclease/phosphatase domain-containing protein n=1 Tax=Pocillopora damicornis TaxID=46731 RepID=A0A3M6TZF3_POCDA|nr:hypothetical protein pdam_00019047 [Pocillopora damicornis]